MGSQNIRYVGLEKRRQMLKEVSVCSGKNGSPRIPNRAYYLNNDTNENVKLPNDDSTLRPVDEDCKAILKKVAAYGYVMPQVDISPEDEKVVNEWLQKFNRGERDFVPLTIAQSRTR